MKFQFFNWINPMGFFRKLFLVEYCDVFRWFVSDLNYFFS